LKNEVDESTWKAKKANPIPIKLHVPHQSRLIRPVRMRRKPASRNGVMREPPLILVLESADICDEMGSSVHFALEKRRARRHRAARHRASAFLGPIDRG
jgi:hypothetical protein